MGWPLEAEYMSSERDDDTDADFTRGGRVEDGGDFIFGNVEDTTSDTESDDGPPLAVQLVDETGNPLSGLVIVNGWDAQWTDATTGRATFEVDGGETVSIQVGDLGDDYVEPDTFDYEVPADGGEVTVTIEETDDDKGPLPVPYRDWGSDSSEDDASTTDEETDDGDAAERDDEPALTLHIEDAEDGSPIAGATVWAKWDGGVFETGPDGTITFEDVPEVQKHFIGVDADGYEMEDYIGIVVLDEAVEETIALEPEDDTETTSTSGGEAAAAGSEREGEGEGFSDEAAEGELSPSEVGALRDALLKNVEAIEEVNLHADGSGELHFSAGHMEVKGDTARRKIRRALPAAYDIQLGQGRMRRDGNLSLEFDIEKA